MILVIIIVNFKEKYCLYSDFIDYYDLLMCFLNFKLLKGNLLLNFIVFITEINSFIILEKYYKILIENYPYSLNFNLYIIRFTNFGY